MAAFFDKAWNEASPDGDDNPTGGDDEIRDFKYAIRERLAQDHYFLASESESADIGFHTKATFLVQGSNPTKKANAIIAFGKDVSNVCELHTINESNQVVQITSGAGLAGQIPSGAVILCKLAACPSGYTDITSTYDKKVIIADSLAGTSPTSGGGAATAGVTGSHTLLTTEIPAHTHSYTSTYSVGGKAEGGDALSQTGATTGSTGGGGGHTHPLSYVGFKLCEKD